MQCAQYERGFFTCLFAPVFSACEMEAQRGWASYATFPCSPEHPGTHRFFHCQSPGFVLFFVNILHFFPLLLTLVGHDFHYTIGYMTAIFSLQYLCKLIRILVLAPLNFLKF